MTVATLEMKSVHPEMDCRSYLLWDPDTKEAAIIDPRFDQVARIREQIDGAGLKLKFAIDTHTHADHLSGSDRLRNIYGCKVAMIDKTKSKVPDLKVPDGEKLKLGTHELTLLHTPGHTPDSTCVFDGARVFTGDTLFIGGAARTDFMGGDAEQLHDSFRKIEALGDDVEVWPGHDYNGKEHSTVAVEKESNEHFRADREQLLKLHKVKGELPANMSEILSFNTEAGIKEDKIITPADVDKLGEPGKDFTLLDERYIDEYEAGRIDAPTVHIPLPELKDRFDELKDMPHPIVSVCRSGVRATMAMMTARHAGDDAWLLLEGGMKAWKAEGKPMTSDTGKEPEVITSKFAVGGGCAAGGGSCAAG